MSRRVPQAELTEGRPGLTLFRPIAMTVNGVVHHGQVTAYGNGVYDVQTSSGMLEVPYDEVDEIAPAIVLLLWQSILLEDITSPSDLDRVHNSILDRLLGQNGQRATKAIPKLLAGIVSRASMPHADDQVPWKCPRTGTDKHLTVGAVVDFAFYKDGNRAIPASVNIGDAYFDVIETRQNQRRNNARPIVPTQLSPRTQRSSRPRVNLGAQSPQGSRDQASAWSVQQTTLSNDDDKDDQYDEEPATRFTDLLAALTSDEPAPKRRRTTPHTTSHETERASGAVSPDRAEFRPQSAEGPSLTQQGTMAQEILALLAPHPHLLIEYAQQLQRLRSATSHATVASESLPVTVNPPPYSRPLTSASDLLSTNDAADRSSQSFRPSRIQHDIHRVISAPTYSGKASEDFMDHVRTSDATLFMPHPAIVSRLVDFDFDSCSLSVLHFLRWDINAQIDRKKTKNVNLRNFSPKVELCDIPPAPRVQRSRRRPLGTPRFRSRIF
ncbi:hypothetical protein DVH05_012326 [Phytophthora capsici]|nr:hypothetical protein DVH05_012326 [Phytophthora capsici]